jgi:uncharacterized membrane protein
MGKSRLEAFSDGVFSIAITLLIFTLKAPGDTRHLARLLTGLWPSYLAYIASFLLIGQAWINHHALLNHVHRTDSTFAVINLFVLLDVAFLPFPTAIVAAAIHDNDNLQVAAILYGLTLAAGGVFFNLLWHYSRRRGDLNPAIEPDQIRRISRRFILGPTSYLAATIVAIVAPAAALALYIFLIVFYLVPGPQHHAATPTTADTNVG